MRKLAVIEFVTLDGVMQSLGSPDEDRDGGFEYGGWSAPGIGCFGRPRGRSRCSSPAAHRIQQAYCSPATVPIRGNHDPYPAKYSKPPPSMSCSPSMPGHRLDVHWAAGVVVHLRELRGQPPPRAARHWGRPMAGLTSTTGVPSIASSASTSIRSPSRATMRAR